MALDVDLDTLFRTHGPLVYRRALQLLGRHDLAEEAVQEVFIRAMRAGDRFDPRARPSTWLYSITTNYCLNQLRDAARRRELLDARGEEVTPASVARDPRKMAALRALLADADPQQAEAAVAVFVEGMAHAEAAEVLGVSRRTVGNLCDRFLSWARARLGEGGA
ncbi:MAG: RNA polymerase sigma factor [Myxococcales bacterium]|nr:RNA polymerase sigma factor [Myxococcales bacterium]